MISFFLQPYAGFSAEEKTVRLIDLTPKTDDESTGSTIQPTASGNTKATDISKAPSEKKSKSEKGVKEEKGADKSGSGGSDEDTDKEEQDSSVQSLINSYILETYKSQWDKILKDMDLSLQKKIPDIEKRIQAYDSIQNTLELRKTKIMKINISEANRSLLSAYFDYMIKSLEKRKTSLESSLSK